MQGATKTGCPVCQGRLAGASRGPLLVSMPEAWAALGIGKSMFLDLLAAGEIDTVDIGRRRLIRSTDLERYVASLHKAA